MDTFTQITTTLEPLFIAATSLGMIVLIIAVYRSNRHSATNIIFVFLSISILLWVWSGYASGLSFIAPLALFFHRLAIFFAAPMSALFLLLAYTLPSSKLLIKKYTFWIIVVLTILMMAVNISPYAFVGTDGVSNPIPGPGLIPFGIISSLFSLFAVYNLCKKYTAAEKGERLQFRIVLIGIFSILLLIIITILIPIIILKSGAFLPFLSIYALIFLGMTAYAIIQYQLFNIKIILTEAVVFMIWIILFSEIFVSKTPTAKAVDILVFVVTVIFGILLIRSVRREIEQRTKIQKLADELEKANENQVRFIHFVTHQVKGFFTTSRDIFSLLLEGEAGEITDTAKNLIRRGFDSDTKGVAMVQDFLNGANIKNGLVKYSVDHFDIQTLISALFIEYKSMAEKKNIQFTFENKARRTIVSGDQEQLKQVFKNLIENAIKYTPKGSISMELIRKGTTTADRLDDGILFTIKDTGVGISDEDKKRLFTEGGQGKDSVKINVDSTGYGLYIAKGIVEAHHGRIWAESEGTGKGSQFYVELPAVE